MRAGRQRGRLVSRLPGRDAAVLRYASVSPGERPRRTGPFSPLVVRLSAPVMGSALLFPRRFDDAVARLPDSPTSAEIAPPYAFRYFGRALHLQIDPARLKWRLSDYVREPGGIRYIGASFLDAADWSGALARLSSSPVHREMLQLLQADLQFRDTKAYRVFRRRAQAGCPLKRNGVALATEAQIEAYFIYCADLIRSVRDKGVVSRCILSSSRVPRFGRSAVRPWKWEQGERDIGVAVDWNGQLIRRLGGKHRTAIAQALKLPRIPVEVGLVHVEWLRGQMERTGLPAHLALKAGLAGLADGVDGRPRHTTPVS